MLKKITVGCIGVLLSLNSALADSKVRNGEVLEFENSGGYTYVKIKDEKDSYWAAIPQTQLKVGDKISIREQMWMENFKSKSLDKTFDKIMFAELPNQKPSNVHGIHGQMIKEKPTPKFDDIIIAKGEALKTNIAELYTKKDEFKNKNVEIEGEVLQVSNKVLGNTWIKISNGKDAVIFRSPNEDEKVAIGDKVKVIGTVNTDVDYGYGFKYKVIGVNAKFEKIN
ncbi:hypothetical protein CP985_03080 [Malaciobacter mytili LMG 24559]|uniref:Nucleotide-binding protein n=1 Tax=Malaciobacter mytili LMG 24559 TaxID=1032238 RepID=A0AAX2AK06_9BACT|nr:hypothetical protein [Malaciobacter mytili]AXH14327.1 hypothetical protein AMYT_0734 [Malaciobacter mytili LMG 24559]RXK16549.1 hypothetical protein CP985_03080 [Malaciobacter mytili LMG 24559]